MFKLGRETPTIVPVGLAPAGPNVPSPHSIRSETGPARRGWRRPRSLRGSTSLA